MILLANKLKTLISETTTSSSRTSVDVVQEYSTIWLTISVTAITDDTTLEVEVFAIGDGFEKSLYRIFLNEATDDEPIEVSLQTGVDIRVRTIYEAGTTYEILAKSIPAPPPATIIKVEQDFEEHQWRRDVLDILQENNKQLQLLVNHARLITGLNKDEGEDF
jgi:hypothetical protein